MTEKTAVFVCAVRENGCFFAGRGLPFAAGDAQPGGLCKAKGGLPWQIAPVLMGAKPATAPPAGVFTGCPAR